MNTLFQDIRQSLRALSRQPLFAGMAVASLALGIGVSTVIFSVVYALLLRPLPYPRADQLVLIGMGSPVGSPVYEAEGAVNWLTPVVFKHLCHDPDSGLSSAGAFGYDFANLTGVPVPQQLTAGIVSTTYFQTFGVRAALGRVFDASDERTDLGSSVILGDGLWRTQFHADPDIVGRTIIIDDKSRTVVGVMGADFKELNGGCELWLPLSESGSYELSDVSQRRFSVTGRLADDTGAGRARLAAYLSTLTARFAQDDPTHYKDLHFEAHPLGGNLLVGRNAARALYLLLGAVACVLLVTCANVANLQLVRAAARRRETGVRLALGASRTRIMRLALTESLLLAGAGAGLGVLLAAWGVDAVAALLPKGYSPVQDRIALSAAEMWFAIAVATLSGVMTGLLPAWAAARENPAGALSGSAGRGASEGPGGTRVRAVFVVVEIALALVLLAGAGLMGRSLLASLRTDAGVRLDRTLIVPLALSSSHYKEAPTRAEFYRRLLEVSAALPGVEGIALTSTPLFSWYDGFTFALPGQSAEDAVAHNQDAVDESVNPEVFATLGVPLRRGRTFTADDRAGAPRVLIVNEAFARKFFPGGDPLGKHLTTVGTRPVEVEIVGVVGDVRRDSLSQDAPAAGYFPYQQRPNGYAAFYLRAAPGIDPESLTKPAAAAIARLDSDQPLGRVQTLEHAASGSVAYVRLYTALFATFAGLTLGLAVLGIYGTVAYSVGLRTREIGIRMALGAQRGDVLRLVLRQGVWLVALGLVLGAGTVLSLAHLMGSLLYGVRPTDPATLVGVAALLGVASLLASWLPARRAARIDPLRALREE